MTSETLPQRFSVRRQLTVQVGLEQLARSVGLRLTGAAAAVLLSFHYSLLTLIRDVGLDTPLAYLGMVPIIAVLIALAVPRNRSGPDIQDRELDHIIGVPLVIGCTLAIWLLPQRMSTVYWDDRLDLPVLPIFLFGVLVLLFGLREAWRYRVPVGYLFLAWQLPYTMLIDHAVDASTTLTIKSLAAVLQVFPFARPTPGGDGSLFHIGATAASGFDVSIASACAGVNSMVGFLVVGIAFLTVTRRRRPAGSGGSSAGSAVRRKLLWLGFGLVLVWVFNLGRLLLVLAVGRQWGETVAIDGLHPYVGFLVFVVAVALAARALPLFDLETTVGRRPASALPRGHRWPRRLATSSRVRGGWRLGASTVALGALVIGGFDGGFSRYELTAGSLGQPRVSGFDQSPVTFGGSIPAAPQSFEWVRRYFGDSSTWHRYTYPAVAGDEVIADVIDAGSLSPFNTYNVQACYAFHGYPFSPQRRVDLGGGIVGFVLDYQQPEQRVTWNVVYWVWKIRATKGERYERVVLLRPSTSRGEALTRITSAPPVQSSPFRGVGYSNTSGHAAPANPARTELIALARQAVHAQPAAS